MLYWRQTHVRPCSPYRPEHPVLNAFGVQRVPSVARDTLAQQKLPRCRLRVAWATGRACRAVSLKLVQPRIA